MNEGGICICLKDTTDFEAGRCYKYGNRGNDFLVFIDGDPVPYLFLDFFFKKYFTTTQQLREDKIREILND